MQTNRHILAKLTKAMDQAAAGRGGSYKASTNGVHHDTDEAIDTLYAWMPPQVAPQPCPEALFSCTLRGKLDGIETLLTVRGQTPEEFRQNLQQVRGLLDAPAPPPALPQGKEWCAVHHIQMQQHTNAKGSWFSHFVDGRHCKGR